MFSIFKKKQTYTNFDFLNTDIHSHLIPGIDDGVKTMEASLDLIRGLQAIGFKKLITTPHVFKEYYPNTSQKILDGLAALRAAVAADGIDIELDAAAEYYLDEHFEELLAKEDLLTLPGNRVLVEMSFISPSPKIEEYVFNMRTKGYVPILAHPERYLYYSNDYHKYERLKDMGCLFQLNLLSLTGFYPVEVRKNAEKMLKRGFIDFAATDLHNRRHLRIISEMMEDKKVRQMVRKYTFLNAEYA